MELTANASTQAKPSDHCFACGSRHPHGLHLRFSRDGDHGVEALWQADEAWESFEGVIHGGIVSTVLDEAMSHAVAATGVPALTCELRVRLRHRIEPGERLHVSGWVVEKRKRKVVTEATLKDREGRERAHAWATFLELHPIS